MRGCIHRCDGERTSQSAAVPEADLRIARRLGFAAVIGAVLWPATFAGVDRDSLRRRRRRIGRRCGFPIILRVACSAGLLRTDPAHGQCTRRPGSAMAAIPLLLVWGMGPWLWPLVLVAIGIGRRSRDRGPALGGGPLCV